MQMADRKPLWEAMRDAAHAALATHTPFTEANATHRVIYAAEIRALVDYVLPKERPFMNGFLLSSNSYAEWRQRMDTRARLLDAAAEAECADG